MIVWCNGSFLSGLVQAGKEKRLVSLNVTRGWTSAATLHRSDLLYEYCGLAVGVAGRGSSRHSCRPFISEFVYFFQSKDRILHECTGTRLCSCPRYSWPLPVSAAGSAFIRFEIQKNMDGWRWLEACLNFQLDFPARCTFDEARTLLSSLWFGLL